MSSYAVSGTDRKALAWKRTLYDCDGWTEETRYREKRKGAPAVAWIVLGWECEPDEDTEWSGCVNRTDTVLAVMVGDDCAHRFEAGDLVAIAREDYCGECGQIGCTHDGLDRTEKE